jgi:chemotaxis protein methyltransferase CheR
MGLLARAYANQGRLDEALEWSEKTIAADKLNSDFHYLHGTILQEKGRFDEAVTSMTRAVFLEPNLVMAHFALGNLARLGARQKDAERHYRVALRILEKFGEDSAVPAAEGMTAGKLTELILAITTKETANGKS